MKMIMMGRDKASAKCDDSPWADRIWVTVKGDDFEGTIALSADTARSLAEDLKSCIEEINFRGERVVRQ